MPRLAEEGYRVVAPAMRGYAPTGRAADGRYDTPTLGQDAIDLYKALDGSRPGVLIGHDWGADAVYAALRADPGRWSAAVAASDPSMAERPVDLVNPAQWRRSWYSTCSSFRSGHGCCETTSLPWSPVCGRTGRPDMTRARTFTTRRRRWRRRAARKPRPSTTYRTPPRYLPMRSSQRTGAMHAVEVPLLYLHGRRDGCIGVDVLDEPAVALPPGTDVHVIEEAGRFLHLEQPDQVAQLVLAHIART